MSTPEPQTHKVIKADKKLQSKAGTGEVDKAAVESAQAFADNNKVVYAEVVTPILTRLRELSDTIQENGDAESQSAILKNIKSTIMDMKGSAATFKYPLVSRLSTPLLLHLESVDRIDKDTHRMLDILYHTVSIVVKNDESSLGNKLAKELEDTFNEAYTKISKPKKK